MVLEADANGWADAIVTFKKRDFVMVAERFGVRVLSPGSALRTETYFAERAARADVPRALDLLKTAGAGAKPVRGDEVIG